MTTHPPIIPGRPGISAATFEVAGIRFSDFPEPGSIKIPYHDMKGKPTGFCRYRLLKVRVDGQKYHQALGSGTRAYIPPQLVTMGKGGYLVIVEGEFKALSLIEAGIKAIGLPSFGTYVKDEKGGQRLLDVIAEVIDLLKPERILFLGDSDTATNYEFSRNAWFLANAVAVPVVLPRIPVNGPGKGVDDCREKLGDQFPGFWGELVEDAEVIDIKSGADALAAQLLERESVSIKAIVGPERTKVERRVVKVAAAVREPLAHDRVVRFAATTLKTSRSAFKKAVQQARTNLRREACERNSEATENSGDTVNDPDPSKPSSVEGSPLEVESLFERAPAEPWKLPVDGDALLCEIRDTLRHYVVLPTHAAETAALFILQTYASKYFDSAPYLNISSPEKRCGKSLTLRLMAAFVDRAMPCSNVSEASVFRLLDCESPTLLIDEVDTFFKDKPELRGMLNAGNVRSEAFVLRCVEVRDGGTTDFEPRKYSVFGPKVFSGIGKLAETLADRCIVISMRRKGPGESCARFRRREFDPDPLRQKCRRWADDHAEVLTNARPELPAELNDRAADVWEPLLATADAVGGEWPRIARAAAMGLSGQDSGTSTRSLGERLLADIYQIFETPGEESMASAAICAKLSALDERPWREIRHGDSINPNKLANLLKAFSITSRKIRLSSSETANGYFRDDFADAWKRYLAPLPLSGGIQSGTNGTTAGITGQSRLFETEQEQSLFRSENTIPTNKDGACSVVPAQRPSEDAFATCSGEENGQSEVPDDYTLEEDFV